MKKVLICIEDSFAKDYLIAGEIYFTSRTKFMDFDTHYLIELGEEKSLTFYKTRFIEIPEEIINSKLFKLIYDIKK